MPNILAELRRRRAGNAKAQDLPPAPPPFDISRLRQSVNKDQSLTASQRQETLGWLNDPVVIQELRSGSIGAALSMVVGKFMNLNPKTQLLLSIAGFGIGKIIYDFKHNQKNFSSWNKQLRMYEIEN